MSDLRKVELHPAFEFICEDCGKGTFVAAILLEQVETAPEDVIFLSNAEPDDWEGQILMAPETVTCAHCNALFQVTADEYDLETMGMFLDDLEDDFDENEDEELFDDEFDDEDEFDDDFDDEDFDEESEEDF